MFGFGDAQDNYKQVYEQQDDNKAELSHELLAGGASFMAMKMFEDKQRKEGKAVSHGFAKELLAGFAGGEVDRLAETKGADFIDREKAKRDAKKNAEQLYDQHYGDQEQYDPRQREPHGHLQESFGRDNFGRDDNRGGDYGRGGDNYGRGGDDRRGDDRRGDDNYGRNY